MSTTIDTIVGVSILLFLTLVIYARLQKQTIADCIRELVEAVRGAKDNTPEWKPNFT